LSITVDNAKLELGSAVVYMKPQGAPGWTNVGGTGSIDISIKQTWADLLAEQLGKTRANAVLVGVEVEIEVPFREISLDNFSSCLSCVQLITDSTDPTKQRLEVRASIGTDLASNAVALKIVPIINGVETADLKKIFFADKAGLYTDQLKWSYNSQSQRELAAKFSLLPDTTKNNRFCYFGDDTAVAA
jgi:hypothetical protein